MDDVSEFPFDSKPKPLDGLESLPDIVPAHSAPEGKPVIQKAPIAPPPIKAMTVPVSQSFGELLKTKQAALKNFLGNDENALRFMSSVMQCVQSNPKLLECTQQSLLGAFMECAAVGLYPTTYSGDCFVIPYAGKAQFQIGYRGMKTLAYRSGVLRCGTDVVFENDKFSEVRGTIQQLKHVPAHDDAGEPIGAYAWAEVSRGSLVYTYLTKEEIMKIKKMSKAASSSMSPWNSNDPLLWMWQKTAFKQLAKMMPTSDKLERAVYLDNVSERGGYIQSEAEVVDVPFEKDPEEKIAAVNDKKADLRKKA